MLVFRGGRLKKPYIFLGQFFFRDALKTLDPVVTTWNLTDYDDMNHEILIGFFMGHPYFMAYDIIIHPYIIIYPTKKTGVG